MSSSGGSGTAGSVRLPGSGKWVRDDLSPTLLAEIDRWRQQSRSNQERYAFWLTGQKGGSWSVTARVDMVSERPDASHGDVPVPHLQIAYCACTTPLHSEESHSFPRARELDPAEIREVIATRRLPGSLVAWIGGQLRATVPALRELTDTELANAAIGVDGSDPDD